MSFHDVCCLVVFFLGDWTVGAVVMEVVGRDGCLRLLPVKSLSTAYQFEVSSAMVSQESCRLLRSLLSLLDLGDCK